MNQQLNKIKEVGIEEYITNYFPKKARRKNIGEAVSFLIIWAVFTAGSLIYIFTRQGEHILDMLLIEGGIYAVSTLIIGLLGLFHAFKFTRIKTDVTSYKEQLTKRHGDYKAALKEIETQLDGEIQGGRTCVTTEDWLVFLCNQIGIHFIHKSEIAGLVATRKCAIIIWDNGKLFRIRTSNWRSLFCVLTKNNEYVLSNKDLVTTAAGNRVTADRLIKNRKLDIFNKNKNSANLIAKQYHENKNAGTKGTWVNI